MPRNSLICKFILLCAFWLGLLASGFAQISVSYVGGAVSGASTPNGPYTALADGWWGGGGGSGPTYETVTCSGGVVVIISWTGTAETRPSHLILAKYSQSEGYSYLATPSADNGLGGPHNSTVQYPIFYSYSGFNSGGPVPSYEVVKFDSQTIFRTISPSSTGNISANAKVKVQVYPVQMTLTGLTTSKELLIGQPLRATITLASGFPLGTPSEYKWYAPSQYSPFLDYVVTDQNSTQSAVYTTFPSPLSTTINQTTCYFAKSGTNKKIRANLLFPNGTQIGVIESHVFDVVEPEVIQGPDPAGTFKFIVNSNPAIITTTDPTDFRMFGAVVPNMNPWGIYWGNWVDTLPEFGSGEFWYTNIITASAGAIFVNNVLWRSDVQTGLDGPARQPATFLTGPQPSFLYAYYSDRPGHTKLRDFATAVTVNLNYNKAFSCYLMFLPPSNAVGQGKAVPLYKRDWQAQGTGEKAAGTREWSGNDGGSRWLESPVQFPPHPVWTTQVVGG